MLFVKRCGLVYGSGTSHGIQIMPRLLRKNVEQVIDLKILFPRSQPNFRIGLNNYQAKKIRRAIREINAQSGSEFQTQEGKYQLYHNPGEKIKGNVQIANKRERIRYMEDNGLPKWQKVIMLPGGQKINKNVTYKNGELSYIRAGEKRSRYRLYTEGTSDDLKNSAKEILKFRNKRKATITAAGRAIGSVIPTTEDRLLIREALYIFNKYASMYENGEMRTRRNANGSTYQQRAAHPSEWGMGILFEENKPKRKGKKK